MVNFTILGPVTASWEGEWTQLAPQQQLLLARLIYAGGKRVEQHDLMSVLSLRDAGLRRVITELRSHLRGVMPIADPIPNEGHGYRLVLDEQQADVFRFRAKHDAALRVPGSAGVRLMREALGEWGHDSAGLYGDCALTGLSGRWADETRFVLGGEHGRAVVWCLQQELKDDGHYPVLAECERRGVNRERLAPGGHRPRAALLDEGFVELWMRAAFRCDQPTRADEIGRWSIEAAGRLDKEAESKLRRLVDRVRAEENPRGTAFPAEPATVDPRPAVPAPPAEEPAAMGDSGGTFNFNNAGAEIGYQVGALHGSIISYGDSTRHRRNGQGEAKDPAEPESDPTDDDV
ncbi:MAG TPA: hypothetical protein VFE59_03445 [Trebonia sp.]|nr:hypothetical protein [Trebonia sp.]